MLYSRRRLFSRCKPSLYDVIDDFVDVPSGAACLSHIYGDIIIYRHFNISLA